MLDTVETVTLRRGALECVLNPGCGGSISRLSWQDSRGPVELMRPAPDPADGRASPHDMACYPLVPFSNRIAGGRFMFEGRQVALPLNQPPCPHAIHGHGWETAWRVDEAGSTSARLSIRHPAGAWPWAYTAVQTFTLDPEGLRVHLELRNDSAEAMPAGLGLHPYFPKPAGTRVKAAVGSVWLNDASMLPVHRIPVPDEWRFSDGRTLDGLVLDNCFAGWNGGASIVWPDRALGLDVAASGPYRHLVIYAPIGEDFFCLEPVTHMTDAVNRPDVPDAGVRRLEPGNTLSTLLRFTVTRL